VKKSLVKVTHTDTGNVFLHIADIEGGKATAVLWPEQIAALKRALDDDAEPTVIN